MKPSLLLLLLLLTFGCSNKPQTCRQLETIVTSEKFEQYFGLCNSDNVSIYIYNSGEGDDPGLICDGFALPCGKPVYFYPADFEISVSDDDGLVFPRISYFKSGNSYQFFETGTNRTFTAHLNSEGKMEGVITKTY